MSKGIFRNHVGKLDRVKSRNMRTSSNDFSSSNTFNNRFNQVETESGDMAHGKLTANLTTFIAVYEKQIISFSFNKNLFSSFL